VRTFLTLMPSAPGFKAADKLTAVVRLQGPASAAPGPFFEKFFDRLETISGVESVSGSTYLPMSGSANQVTAVTDAVTTNVWKGIVTPNYFDEMQIAIARGRGFSARDDGSAPAVAIVNEAMVRRAWPAGGDPLGATVAVENADGRRDVRHVVGVIRDTRSLGVDLKARPELYVPFAQSPDPWLNVIIRTRDVRDPRLPVAVRAAAAAIDASQVVDRFVPMQDMLDSRVATPRFGAWLLGVFAAMAVLLAAVGLAASIAWWVAERTREIGVRMALGAQTGDVTRMFLRQGLLLTTAGLLLGLGAAAASTRLLQSWLYGVTPLDRAVFAGSAVAMLGIAALASYIPARRAARVDPLIALRSE
jgi:putative ABC transport system permease protein